MTSGQRPAPLDSGGDTQVYVYGDTAVFVVFSAALSAKMIYFVFAVVGLSSLLLTAVFRSVVAATNLLATGLIMITVFSGFLVGGGLVIKLLLGWLNRITTMSPSRRGTTPGAPADNGGGRPVLDAITRG